MVIMIMMELFQLFVKFATFVAKHAQVVMLQINVHHAIAHLNGKNII